MRANSINQSDIQVVTFDVAGADRTFTIAVYDLFD